MITILFALSGFVMIVLSYAGKLHWSDGILFLRSWERTSAARVVEGSLLATLCIILQEGEFEQIIQKIYSSIKDKNN